MPGELACIEERCRARYAITDVLYNCPQCGGLLEAVYAKPALSAAELKVVWRERRMSNEPLDQSGVWRYREFIPFLDDLSRVVTLREGCTPLLPGRLAAEYGGLDAVVADAVVDTNLKKAVAGKVRLSQHRLRFKVGETGLDSNSKKLSDSGVKSGTTLALRDLGPQV